MEFDYERNIYSCKVQPLDKRVETLHPPHLLLIQFVYQIHQRYVHISDTTGRTLIHESEENHEAFCLYDLGVLKDSIVASTAFSLMLSSLGIDEREHEKIVDKIIRYNSLMISADIGQVLSINTIITRRHTMYQFESSTFESFAELETLTNNIGMVPATESSIKELLGRVRVVRVEEEEEYTNCGRRCVDESKTCAVCLEEFDAGTYASAMPCSHVFHEKCIVKWLNQSHYCPICRFEMPC